MTYSDRRIQAKAGRRKAKKFPPERSFSAKPKTKRWQEFLSRNKRAKMIFRDPRPPPPRVQWSESRRKVKKFPPERSFSAKPKTKRWQEFLSWRGRRDLNPRAGFIQPTPLAGEPLRPLGYFRRSVYTSTNGNGGESGIRTHGDLRLAGFQDRFLQPLGHLSVDLCGAHLSNT